jgi:Calx-beta domain-containing protein
VTMSYRTANGTATTGDSDYVAKTGTLTFNPGETTKTITIEVKGDRNKEGNETFYLDLFGNSSNSLFTKNRGVGTILNDDGVSAASSRLSSASAFDAAIADFMSVGSKKHGT